MKNFSIVFLTFSALVLIACSINKVCDNQENEVIVTFKPKLEPAKDTIVYFGEYKQAYIEQLLTALIQLVNDSGAEYHGTIEQHSILEDTVIEHKLLRSVTNLKIGKRLKFRGNGNISSKDFIVEDKKSEKTSVIESLSSLHFISENKKYIMQYYYYGMKINVNDIETYLHRKTIKIIKIIQDYSEELIFIIEEEGEKTINKHISENEIEILYKELVNYLSQHNIIIDYTDVYYNNEKTDKQALYLKISKDDFSELIPKTDIKSEEMVDYDREEFERIFNEEMERLKEKEKSD